jgi:polyisoprenoid-binding protein YceI
VTDIWTLDAADGELLVRTGVKGRAARMGHRLTIAMTRWQATVRWAGADPVAAEFTVDTDSFEVVGSQGGVKGLSSPEKALVRSNALSSLDAGRFPDIRFTTDEIDETENGYRLNGTLQIRGKQRKHVIDLRTEDSGDSWQISTESTVRQSDYGIKPYSLLMGSVRVADDVTLSFSAVHAKDD